jgi:DNA repair protein RadC
VTYRACGPSVMTSSRRRRTSRSIELVRVKLVRESVVSYSCHQIDNAADVAEIVWPLLGDSDREHLLVLSLDCKRRPTSINVASIGTLTASLVHPREVFKPAILSNAAAIILVHNHPSGIPEPSLNDCEVFQRIYRVGKVLGIPLLDHVILGDSIRRFVSMRAWILDGSDGLKTNTAYVDDLVEAAC